MSRRVLLPLVRELCRRRSVIVGYHGVDTCAPTEDPANLVVPPERFRRQVELLIEGGFELLTVAELAARADGGPPPAGLAALSFDDGMRNNHSVLLPILRDYGIGATVYVTTGLIGGQNPWMRGSSPMMTEDELRDLAAAGVELGAHTVTHPDLSLMDREACLREMEDSRRVLEELTGSSVSTFAYPFCRYGSEAVAAARDAGFAAAVTCEGRGGWSPLEMKRAMLTGKDGAASFALKLADAYRPLFNSLPGRALRISTRRVRLAVRGARDTRRG